MKYANRVLFLSIIFGLISVISYGQTPAKYICNKFEGELTKVDEERSFMGDAYKCTIEEQWDMMITSKVNELILNDDNFGNAKDWSTTRVDSEIYTRRSFSFDTGEFFIVNLYVPYEKKTDHFFIAE